jgi:hypothetical protein
MAALRTHYKKKPKVQPSMSIFSVLTTLTEKALRSASGGA